MYQGDHRARVFFGRFALRVLPALLYVVAVFYLGTIPLPHLPEVTAIGTDKIGHCFAFLGMVVVFMRAAAHLWPTLSDAQLRIASGFASAAAGGLLEIYQMAVPGRSADILDWAADCVGAALAALVVRSRWAAALE